MTGIAVDKGADAVGLWPPVGGGFAQLAQQNVRAAFYGLAVRLYDGVGVLVFLFRTQLVAFQMVVDDEQAVAAAVYPAGQAVVASGGIVDVYGVAQEGKARQESYATTLPYVVACGVEPLLVGVEEFPDFLQADDVSISNVEEADEFRTLLVGRHLADVEGYDAKCAVCVLFAISKVQGAVVENVAAYDEYANYRHPRQTYMEEQPEHEEERVGT